jgi:hypothetical protein
VDEVIQFVEQFSLVAEGQAGLVLQARFSLF